MKYPILNNYLIFREDGSDEYEVTDYLSGDTFRLSHDITDALRKLDGKRPLSTIADDLSQQQIDRFVELLEDHDLLRHYRCEEKSLRSFTCTLWIPKFTARTNSFCRVFAFLLMLCWLPVLVAGMVAFVNCFGDLAEENIAVGLLLGLCLGIPCHELSHAFCGIAFHAPVFEFGIMQSWLMPGAYVMMDTEEIKGRLRKAQVHAAGIEMNLLLTGIFLLLSTVFVPFATIFLYAAAANLILALINLCLIGTLDGMHIMENLLGTTELSARAKAVILHKKRRKALREEGIQGIVKIAVCYMVVLFQVALPLLIIINCAGVFLLFQ